MLEWKTTSTILGRLRDHADGGAWEDFVAHFRVPIFNLARRLGLSPTDAEDVVQETLLAFAKNYRMNRYDRERGRLRNWLLGIAHNQAVAIRRKARNHGRSMGFHDDAAEGEPVEPPKETMDWWEAEWERNVYERCIERVRSESTPQTMDIFRRLVMDGKSNADVAAELGLPLTTIYNVRSRVTKRIVELARIYQDA